MNRLTLPTDYPKLRYDAICAAQFPNGYHHNPWPMDSREWHCWVREFNREIQRLADRELVWREGRWSAWRCGGSA